MIKFKKLLAVMLTVILCFSVCAISASAADNCTAKANIATAFMDANAAQIRVTITTTEKCGAISATLTATGATFENNTTSASLIEKTGDDNKYTVSEDKKTIKFVVVTDKLEEGDKVWASFIFNVEDTNMNFTLSDIEVCDITATKLGKPTQSVESVTKLVSTTLGTIGATPRIDSNGFRFESRLNINTETNAITNISGATAVSCGYIVGYDFNIRNKNNITNDTYDLKDYVQLDNSNKLVVKEAGKGVNVIQSKYYISLDSVNNYMTLGFSIKDFTKDGNKVTTEVGGVTYTLYDEAIVYMPYVVYKNSEGQYSVAYGDQIMRSCAQVMDSQDLAN